MASADPMQPALAVGTEIAGYRVEAFISRGGMAVVYRGHDRRLGRRVALKLLAPELSQDERFQQRFLRESRLAASLDHPNIVPIYEAGEASGLLYIVMRYVEGSDLRALLDREGPLDLARTISIMRQVGAALDAAHARGLVHRDVKPGNILIASGTGREDPDHVYLTDFGLTKRSSSLSGQTTTGRFIGTMDYVAPSRSAASRSTPAPTSTRSVACSTSAWSVSRRSTGTTRRPCSGRTWSSMPHGSRPGGRTFPPAWTRSWTRPWPRHPMTATAPASTSSATSEPRWKARPGRHRRRCPRPPPTRTRAATTVAGSGRSRRPR